MMLCVRCGVNSFGKIVRMLKCMMLEIEILINGDLFCFEIYVFDEGFDEGDELFLVGFGWFFDVGW